MKTRKKQLAFHKTSNTLRSTTSCSSPRGHSNPHSSTGDGGARDDNMKKSNSSTSSSLGGTHNPCIPAHRGPTLPAPDPAPTSRSPSPDGRPHSPPPADEEGSSPASKDAGKDPWVHTPAARKVKEGPQRRRRKRKVGWMSIDSEGVTRERMSMDFSKVRERYSRVNKPLRRSLRLDWA